MSLAGIAWIQTNRQRCWGLVAIKNVLGRASLENIATAEKLTTDALNRTKNGRKVNSGTLEIMNTAINMKAQFEQQDLTFENPRQQAEKLLKIFRQRAKVNPSFLKGLSGILDTIAEGDMGILFFPQGEDIQTQKAILDTWGILNDVAYLLEQGKHNKRMDLNIAEEKIIIDTSKTDANSYQQPKLNPLLSTLVVTTLALAQSGCSDANFDAEKIIKDAQATSEAAVEQVCNPNIITDINLCRQLGGPENIGDAPDIQNAVEKLAGRVYMGDPLYSQLPEAMRLAISLYQQTKGVTGFFAENPQGEKIEVGMNFTEVEFDEQREIVENLVQKASNEGLRTELEIGPKNTLNPCPENSLCIKVGLENPDTSGYKIGGEPTSFTGIFKMDVGKLLAEKPELAGKFDSVYTVSPFPVTEEGNIASIKEISKTAFNMTKEGGKYIIWFNPYFNSEFMNSRPDQEKNWPTTEDMYIEVVNALWGQYKGIDYGPYSIMKERYPNLKLPQSEFSNESNESAINVLIIKK